MLKELVLLAASATSLQGDLQKVADQVDGRMGDAKVVADKFHVVRLLHPAINRMRKDITGDKRTLKIRRYLLMKSSRLDFFTRSAILRWLEDHPDLREVYHA